MHLEIVSHCWHYTRLLNYQLSSLILHPPRRTIITMTVFFTPSDTLTQQVLRFFSRRVDNTQVRIRRWRLPMFRLMRREIGRNQAALATVADWVWFTDCDYCFGPEALDAAADALQDITGPLAFPRQTLVSATPALGDAAIERLIKVPQTTWVQPEDFIPFNNERAIGGIQIARGEIVQQTGYLNGSRYLRPARKWQRTFGDVAFRQQLGTSGTAVEIPYLYRILHAKAGRNEDVSL